MTTDELPPSNGEPEHVVVLVHGTFARGAAWTSPHSKLGGALKSSLHGDLLLTAFEWSGRNSHEARLAGGSELAQGLRLLRKDHPSASLHVIAHSHGGNVVGYALRAPSVRQGLDGVVCLGTPFVVSRPRDLKPTLTLLKLMGITFSVLSCLFFVLLTVLLSTMIVYVGDVSSVLFAIQSLAIAGYACFVAARFGVRVGHYVEDRVRPRLQAIQEEIVASLNADFGDTPVLNVQARRDEAALYLRVIERIASVPYRAWSPLAMGAAFLVITAVFVSGYAYVMIGSDDWRQAPLEALGGFILGLLVYVATVIVLSLALTAVAQVTCILWAKLFRGHALGFGEEGVIKNWLVAISATSHPSNAERVRDEVFIVKGDGLHHSLLYEDQAVLRLISGWLRASPHQGQEKGTG